jgi:RNA polymerase sigma factor (sigma-70 family)
VNKHPKPSLRSVAERDALAATCHRMVHKIARQLEHHPWVSRLDYDDRVQAGMVGLLRAAELYEPERGWKFSTYAHWSIKRNIVQAGYGETLVHIPQNHLASKDPEVVPELLELSKRAAAVPLSLSMPFSGDDEDPIIRPSDHRERDPGIQAEDSIHTERLEVAIRQLSEKMQLMVRARWLEGKTLEQCGDLLGISKERARQILTVAMRRLQAWFGVLQNRHCEMCGEMMDPAWVLMRCWECRQRVARVKKLKRARREQREQRKGAVA